MTKTTFRTAAMTAVLLSAGLGTTRAQDARYQQLAGNYVTQAAADDAAANGAAPATAAPATLAPARPIVPPAAVPAPAYAQIAPGYPYLNAPMYSCPRQDVPYQMGGTYITNQAFYPQEMMHAHEYKAMYPPFYYRAHGGWIVTPFGVHSHEAWELQGTVVKVKYMPRYCLFSGFHAPLFR